VILVANGWFSSQTCLQSVRRAEHQGGTISWTHGCSYEWHHAVGRNGLAEAHPV
jgi:hypothetical protein